MKKFTNLNFFWSSIFVEQLSTLDVQHVCISPGSRNTPLSLAFAENKKIKKFIIVDERSSGFFALGIAKKTKKPVALVTTSGTAVAELYPAIIEAYQQRIPLVICTADRPAFQRRTGANQTINQDNIFKNHIRSFWDFGLPQINKNKLDALCTKTIEKVFVSESTNPGPIHFNFPFEKPLEPSTFTDEISFNVSDFVRERKQKLELQTSINRVIWNKIKSSEKILFLVSWGKFENKFYKELINLSKINDLPILVDGTSDLRFVKYKCKNLIVNHSSLLMSKDYQSLIEPDLIIQFGNAPTSQTVLSFINNTKAKKITVNEFGDRKDPSENHGLVIKQNPTKILNDCLSYFEEKRISKNWLNQILKTETMAEDLKNKIIGESKFGIESRITNELISVIPTNSNLFISNSMPVRDFDFFASRMNKNINIVTNRGASGIDGIISTASGVASQTKQNTFLLIGDLAFYHNLTALSNLAEFKIPLIIILINNNGGGIFSMLPIAKEKKHFEKLFTTPLSLNYSKFVKGFGGAYHLAKTWKSFLQVINQAISTKVFSVIEIKTDSEKSLKLRKDYWTKLEQELSIRDDNRG